MRALWVLARPGMVPWLLLLVGFGYGLGHWDRAWGLRNPMDVACVCLAWVALHAGTLWLNAARDRDDGPVLFGGAGASTPAGLTAWAYGALGFCLLAAAPAGLAVWFAAAANVGLAVLYSHPWSAWKAHPVAGPLVNVAGYGVLTPLAGFLVVGGEMTPRAGATIVLVALSMGAVTFAAQAFQERDDRARGDRTLVATHGPQATLIAARLGLTLASVGALVLVALGWYPRACVVGLPGMWWMDQHLRRWIARGDGGRPQDAKILLQRMLLTGLAMLVAAVVVYVWRALHGLPAAGLGTVAGHPPG